MLRWGIVVLAVIVAVVAWLATRGGGDNESESEPVAEGFAARIVDEAELADIAASTEHPIYWAGPVEGKELEVSETKQGNTQVRYLKDGADPGAEAKTAITIGSYPLADPSKELEGYAELKGAVVFDGSEGRKLFSNVKTPGSIYFASPGNSVQVEVYAPSRQGAIKLANSGKVQPVG